MSNITSEKFRLAHLERDLRRESFEKQSAADFREYLILLINKVITETGDVGDKEYALLVKKLIGDFSRQQQKFTLESAELLKAAEQAKQDFEKLIEKNDEPSTLPQDILDLSSEIPPRIDESYKNEEIYYKQKALCEEISKMIAKLNRASDKSENENHISLLQNLVGELVLQQPDAEKEMEILKKTYYDSELESLRKIDEVIEAIRLNDLKNKKQRGEE